MNGVFFIAPITFLFDGHFLLCSKFILKCLYVFSLLMVIDAGTKGNQK
jgi:hypothetical protein